MLTRHLAPLALAAALAACSTPQPLYQWGQFTEYSYDTLRGAGKSPAEQVDLMRAHGEKVAQSGKKLPPGFHAHMALLYLQLGRKDLALTHFDAERQAFPESAAYVDSLIKASRTVGSDKL
jgi:hypothetical protein